MVPSTAAFDEACPVHLEVAFPEMDSRPLMTIRRIWTSKGGKTEPIFFNHPRLQLEHRLIPCHAALMREHSEAMKIDSSRATGRMGTELFGACLIEMFALCVRIWRWRR